jgi:hypothetical protein
MSALYYPYVFLIYFAAIIVIFAPKSYGIINNY